MRHIKIIGLCLAAVFAIAAVTAGTASAKKPEWGKCEAQAGGKYKDANCQEKASGGTGAFEWHKGATLPNQPFSGHSVGSGGLLFSSVSECLGAPQFKRIPRSQCEAEGHTWAEAAENEALEIECASETNTGEAIGKNHVGNVHVTFKGCVLLGGPACTGEGLPEGEIHTTTLRGELGYINAGKHEVGVVLEPAEKHGPFAEFLCLGGILKTVVGVGNKKEGAHYSPESKGGWDQIISPITPINEETSTYEQVYNVNHANFTNVPSSFEGKHTSLLEDYIEATESGETTQWTKAGEEIVNVNTPVNPGEIKG